MVNLSNCYRPDIQRRRRKELIVPNVLVINLSLYEKNERFKSNGERSMKNRLACSELSLTEVTDASILSCSLLIWTF